jgi:hypothetical protein
MIRNSLTPGLILSLMRSEWQVFLAEAKEGLFDGWQENS